MLKKYESVCYELLRPGQVKAIREKCPVVYIVAGSLEWHGVQNPLGTDSLKAHAICCEAALKYGGVVLPPFYQGLLGKENWGPKGWEGFTLSFNEDDMFKNAMLGICRALTFSKWKVIAGVTGHDVDEQRDTMGQAIKEITDGKTSTGFAVCEGDMHEPDDNIPLGMDHAAAWETSCMMYAQPDKVDLSRLKEEDLADLDTPGLKLPERTAGIGGKNPLKFSSKEMGQKIIERMGDMIGKKALEYLNKLS
jgi:creatinine amidohydrolase